jgi:carnitine O-acetyltransferase
MPALEDTCDRFISWCAPLLTAEDLAATEIAVRSFQAPDGPGRRLNHVLKEAAYGAPSWLDAFWASRYLGWRGRIALDANFFLTLADSVIPADPSDPQVSRAAGLVAAAVSYQLALDAGLVPPVLRHDKPVSMHQHRMLFSTTRIPGAAQDTLRTPYTHARPGNAQPGADSGQTRSGPTPACHIVVFHRGAVFRLEVIAPNGEPYAPAQLAGSLRVITDAVSRLRGEGVGHFTSQDRSSWAASRAALLARDPANARALDTVETALLCLCLDDVTPRDARSACDHLLHGDSANRWFDKALSLIVFADGTAGVNIERSSQDPATIQDFLAALTDPPPPADASARASAGPSARPPDVQPEAASSADGPVVDGPAVERVRFVLDDDLRAATAAAGASFAAHAAAIATATVALDDFGAATARRLGASPDAFVELACQLAHSRVRGMLGASRESIATRHYRHGRTEPMRVVTPEVVGFVAAMDDPLVDAAIRRSRFRAAQAKHVERTRQCQAGQAPEQHLRELQFIQQRSGAAIGVPSEPALYRTPGWRLLCEDYLSTAPAYSPSVGYFGFGPAGPKCISVGYVLQPASCQLYLTTRASARPPLNSYARHLRTAVTELHHLLANE